MITEICEHLRNWFTDEAHDGTFVIENGIVLPFVKNGQYYRIIGSVFNDGVHRYGDPEDELISETFEGTISPMRLPKAFTDLCGEIEAWQEKNGDVAASPFTSESFGGYSYTKGSGGDSAGAGGGITWQKAFRGRLNAWRKI